MVKKATSTMLDDYLAGDSVVSRTYRRGAGEKPPARLDAAVLAAARRALAPAPGRNTVRSPWMKPVSAAAVMVLSVMLVVFMAREEAAPWRTGENPIPPATPTAGHTPDAAKPAAAERSKPPGPAAAYPAKPRAGEAGPRTVVPPVSAVIEKADKFTKTAPLPPPVADIVSVKASGPAGAYRFMVTVKSPDTGCRQYADWWEVLNADGRLLYRFVMPHSHMKQQPFPTEGGPVPIQPDTLVWVRAHMHSAGYGGVAFKGSVRAGFEKTPLSPKFAAELGRTGPLPERCEY